MLAGRRVGEGLQIPNTRKPGLLRAGPRAAAVFVLVLFISIMVTAPVRAALPAGAPATVSAEASPQLFATMCALYAAGFEAESSTLGSDAEVSTLRSQLLALHGPAAEALRAYYRGHVLANPGATMSRYITFALVAGPPPNFALTITHEDLPPDALALEDFSGVLAQFYQEAQLDRLWMQLQPGYDRAVAAERQPLGQIVLLETGYLREILRPGKRSFTVYVEPLVSSRTNVRNMGDRYAVVLNPGVDSSAEIRHAFLHFMLDPLPIRYGDDLKQIAPLYDAALRAPRLPFEFHDDFSAFVTECLVHAVELRIRRLPAAELAAEVNSEESEGYVLVRPLIRALQKFEASQPPMSAYFPDLIRSIDVGTEFNRLKTVAFAPASNYEDAASTTGTVDAASANLKAELAAMLADGDRLIAAQDPVGAASEFPASARRSTRAAACAVWNGRGDDSSGTGRTCTRVVCTSGRHGFGSTRCGPRPRRTGMVAHLFGTHGRSRRESRAGAGGIPRCNSGCGCARGRNCSCTKGRRGTVPTAGARAFAG